MIFQILDRITLLFIKEELRCCPEIIEEQIRHHIQYDFSMIIMSVIVIIVNVIFTLSFRTFSIGKSRRGDEIAAAAASCARDLPKHFEIKGKEEKE